MLPSHAQPPHARSSLAWHYPTQLLPGAPRAARRRR